MRLFTLLFFLLAVSPVIADDDDETLKFYLSKADLVVVGKISSDPIGIINETGVPNYNCDFLVSAVIKGDAKLEGQVIKVNIKRFEIKDKDKHPLINSTPLKKD